MKIELDMPTGLEEKLKELVLQSTKEALVLSKQQLAAKEWLTMKEAAAYAGVSYNSFIKFREMGLKVAEIDGIKRVSKKEIDSFLQKHSF